MMVRNIINIIFKFLIFFVIFIVLGYILTRILLKEKNSKKKLSSKESKFFGIFMELDNKAILSLSVVVTKYIFIIYVLFNRNDLIEIHLYIFLFFSLIYVILTKSIKNLIIELISSFSLYYTIFFSKLLSGYINEIRFTWYIFIGNTLLIIFIFMYSTYFFIRNVDDIVSKNKLIRSDKNEKN